MSLFSLLMATGCSENQLIGEEAPPLIIYNPSEVAPESRTDRYLQNKDNKTDIYFIVDNSGSMSDEQVKLAQNFPAFIQYFASGGYDFHIGVITTDMQFSDKQGKLQSGYGFYYIDRNTPEDLLAAGATDLEGNPADLTDVFTEMAMVGNHGSSTEQGVLALQAALHDWQGPGEANEGFRRDDANLHAILISDEPDQSGDDVIVAMIAELNDTKFTSEYAQVYGHLPDDDFIDDMISADDLDELTDEEIDIEIDEALTDIETGSADNVRFHSIMGPHDDEDSFELDYDNVTQEVGGTYWPITSSNWSPIMETLGVDIAGLKDEFYLSGMPVPETIEVGNDVYNQRTGELIVSYELFEGVQWEYVETRNSIKFTDVSRIPPGLSEVTITYELASSVDGG